MVQSLGNLVSEKNKLLDFNSIWSITKKSFFLCFFGYAEKRVLFFNILKNAKSLMLKSKFHLALKTWLPVFSPRKNSNLIFQLFICFFWTNILGIFRKKCPKKKSQNPLCTPFFPRFWATFFWKNEKSAQNFPKIIQKHFFTSN